MSKADRKEKAVKRSLKKCGVCSFMFSPDRAQCPSCRSWNMSPVRVPGGSLDGTVLASEVNEEPIKLLSTGPWDRIFGSEEQADGTLLYGLPTIGVFLISGDPGAGKSTLAIQLADAILDLLPAREILYIAAEEAAKQVKSRLKRLRVRNSARFRILPLGVTYDLASILESRRPAAVIVDSFPRLVPNAADAKEFLANLKEYVVVQEFPAILINHITKSGDMAGTMADQHDVDGTIDFMRDEADGSGKSPLRYLNVVKNRFGEDGLSLPFKMTARGLVALEPEAKGDTDDEEDEEGYDDEEDDD